MQGSVEGENKKIGKMRKKRYGIDREIKIKEERGGGMGHSFLECDGVV